MGKGRTGWYRIYIFLEFDLQVFYCIIRIIHSILDIFTFEKIIGMKIKA